VLNHEKPLSEPLGEVRVNLDPDVATTQLVADDARRGRSRERVEDQVAGSLALLTTPPEQFER
jgi:hypothetical protein